MEAKKSFNQVLSGASLSRQVLFTAAFFLMTFSVGVSTGLVLIQTADISKQKDGFYLTSDQISWMASIGILVGVPAHLLGGYSANRLGRRTSALIVCPILLAGFLTSHLATPDRTYLLYLGRIVQGVAGGLQHSSCSSYYTEMSAPQNRTAIHSLSGFWFCFGVLCPICLAAGGFTWSNISLIAISSPLLAFVAIGLAPETPSWLITKGRLNDAKKALLRLRGPDFPHQDELRYLQKSYSFVRDRPHAISEILGRMVEPDVWKPVLLVILSFLLLVGCGNAAIDRYGILIFEASGSTVDIYTSVIFSTCMKMVGQLLGAVLLVKVKRRPLYIISASLTCIGLTSIGLSIWFNPISSQLYNKELISNTANSQVTMDSYNGTRSIISKSSIRTNFSSIYTNSSITSTISSIQNLPSNDIQQASEVDPVWMAVINYVPILGSCLFTLAYSFGISPITYSYSNELFPLDLRSQLCGFMTSLSQLEMFVLVKNFSGLSAVLGVGGTFLCFGGVSFLVLLWGIFFVPETKDKTQHEVSKMFYSPSQLRLKRVESGGYTICPTK